MVINTWGIQIRMGPIPSLFSYYSNELGQPRVDPGKLNERTQYYSQVKSTTYHIKNMRKEDFESDDKWHGCILDWSN